MGIEGENARVRVANFTGDRCLRLYSTEKKVRTKLK